MGQIVSVDPETAAPVPCPEGVWDVIITKTEFRIRPDDAPFDQGDGEVAWFLRWDDPNLPPEVQGQMHVESTNTMKGKALKFVKFAQALGFDPMAFDPDSVLEHSAKARVSHRQGKTRAGERRTFVRVDDLMSV